MFFFFGYGPGIVFFLLGPFIIIGGLRRGQDRRKLWRSGLGSMMVGAGNILILHNWMAGLAVIGVGIWMIVSAVRMGS
jgi:hypothetical protein